MEACNPLPGERARPSTDCVSRKTSITQAWHTIVSQAQWSAVAAALDLAPRQADVAWLMCEGHTYKSIALHLGISINTVRMHLRVLFAKLRAHDRVGLLIRILEAERTLGPCWPCEVDSAAEHAEHRMEALRVLPPAVCSTQ